MIQNYIIHILILNTRFDEFEDLNNFIESYCKISEEEYEIPEWINEI